uniref:Uncharacterized protein n=1 Tax=Brassica oleracea TaxID=3712 RepID=A0A3P6CAU2_BRAOL|nr:unnamed protein product [Brassica oleracea]
MVSNTCFFLFATTDLLLALNISGRIIPEATADPTNIATRLNGGGLMEKPTSFVASVSLQIPVVLPLLLTLEKFDHIHMWLKRTPPSESPSTDSPTHLATPSTPIFSPNSSDPFPSPSSTSFHSPVTSSGTHKILQHIVVLQQDTVSLTVAESSADFSCISNKGLRPESELRALVPELPVPLTPHLSCLSRSLSSRTKASPSEPPSTMPSWTDKRRQNRSIINVPAGLEPKILELMSYLEKGSARSLKLPSFKELNDVVRITLELSQENVDKLKERAKNESTHVRICMDLHGDRAVSNSKKILFRVGKTR